MRKHAGTVTNLVILSESARNQEEKIEEVTEATEGTEIETIIKVRLKDKGSMMMLKEDLSEELSLDQDGNRLQLIDGINLQCMMNHLVRII